MEADLVSRAFEVFRNDVNAIPPMTLRSGNAVDDYDPPIPFDETLDAVDSAYLEKYFFGLPYLDPVSWRHYLPHLIRHALEHLQTGSNAVEALLSSLRPPDRNPARSGSLTKEEEQIIVEFLEVLAFDPKSSVQEFACQVMEEWWIPKSLYRNESAQQTVAADRADRPRSG